MKLDMSHGSTARTRVPLAGWFWWFLLHVGQGTPLLGTVGSLMSNTAAIEAFALNFLSARKLRRCRIRGRYGTNVCSAGVVVVVRLTRVRHRHMRENTDPSWIICELSMRQRRVRNTTHP